MANDVEIIGPGITVYLGDCREILPSLGRVQAIVTDPPYGNKSSRNYDGHNASRGKLADPTDYGKSLWDDTPVPNWLISLILEISDHQIIFGGNYYELPPTSCWLVWDKKNTGDFADCELAWTNLPKAVRKIEWLWNGMIRKGSDVREHPTQKPVGVMAWALDQLPANTGDICDPFMGSGTTGVAAIDRGLGFCGIEKERKYFEIACRRISDAMATPRMFYRARTGHE